LRPWGFNPQKLSAAIATHAHIDHIGALHQFQEEFGVKVIAHQLETIHIPGHTAGGIAVYVDMEKRIPFGQDIHGPYFFPGADPGQAKISLERLIDLEADILCEGHFGIYQPKAVVKRYIEQYLFSLY